MRGNVLESRCSVWRFPVWNTRPNRRRAYPNGLNRAGTADRRNVCRTLPGVNEAPRAALHPRNSPSRNPFHQSAPQEPASVVSSRLTTSVPAHRSAGSTSTAFHPSAQCQWIEECDIHPREISCTTCDQGQIVPSCHGGDLRIGHGIRASAPVCTGATDVIEVRASRTLVAPPRDESPAIVRNDQSGLDTHRSPVIRNNDVGSAMSAPDLPPRCCVQDARCPRGCRGPGQSRMRDGCRARPCPPRESPIPVRSSLPAPRRAPRGARRRFRRADGPR